MTQIAIVYHSGYGHTKVVAERIQAGAQSVAGVSATLVPVEEVESRWTDLAAADALVFGSPTYMGTVSAPFKTFMDASSKVWIEQGWKDKVAGGFTISGSPSGDKLNTLQTLMVFAQQHGMVWVGNAILPYNDQGLNRLGSMTGVMAQAGQVPPDVEPNEADRKTAEAYGARLAAATLRWVKGA